MRVRLYRLFAILMVLAMLVTPAWAGPARQLDLPKSADQGQSMPAVNGLAQTRGLSSTDGLAGRKTASHRLLVELSSPPLAQWVTASASRRLQSGKMDLNSAEAQNYVAQLKNEQAVFVTRMQTALPSAAVDNYKDESGNLKPLAYQVVFNGLTIDPGTSDKDAARKALAALPGVKGVYPDYAHQPDLYASVPLINAAAAYNNVSIGGVQNAGKGIKFASMDGGVHKDAAMFSGAGYSYPPDYPVGGLGMTANNNGKIILSKAYFRSWDPPKPGEQNPWPGTSGTSHGVHTSSTAAGEAVVASFEGITQTVAGVAPKAWIMSYRVFYDSVTNDGSFYNAEGIAALEDIARDGADVLNNSWGGGPTSIGGEYDPLDQALLNVYNAGTFVSMSNGNAGPGLGSSDHPSPEYINVAATTTSGTFSSGRLGVSKPEPVPANLKGMAYASASFGPAFESGKIYTFTFTTARSVDPANEIGCNEWTGTPFAGKAVLISRGTCDFSLKVAYAQRAGATFVIVYNHATGGDSLINMGAGELADEVTIPSIFVGRTNGLGMVDWYTAHGAASELEFNTVAFQSGNIPDWVADFSSRGPGAGNVLKPDIAAPGVNILAQGYAAGATGEARHLGWGQASGTSMASPHVSGAAILLRQIHPSWTNAAIKSALMSTSKFVGIWNSDRSHAQPLDMGAGRLDLTRAADPGLLFDTPSLSYGQVVTHTGSYSLRVMATSVADSTQTYTFLSQSVGGTYPTATLSANPAFSISPASVTLAPGASGAFTVTFNSQLARYGDNQAYISLNSAGYQAHLPAWARVVLPLGSKVLIIDNDASTTLGRADYLDYYADTLLGLGVPFDVYDADDHYGPRTTTLTTLPDLATLSQYSAILYFTGDNYQPYDTFAGVYVPPTPQDMDRLMEYVNGGGHVIAMGQDVAAVMGATDFDDAHIFYTSGLGGYWLQDSVSAEALPGLPVISTVRAPASLQSINLSLGGGYWSIVKLTGAEEVPPVATTAGGTGRFALNNATRDLSFDISLKASVTNPITVTRAFIHDGAAGANGPVLYTLYAPATPTVVTDTLGFSGSATLTVTDVAKLKAGGLYVNIHTTSNPAGLLRSQIVAFVNGDGAGNQNYVDELRRIPAKNLNTTDDYSGFTPLLTYPGTTNVENGIVAMGHRQQPTLENPGITYLGRSVYTSFGLEGVNNGLSGYTTREGLLSAFFTWMDNEVAYMITNTSVVNNSGLVTFRAVPIARQNQPTLAGGSSYRWDFGDGSAILGPITADVAAHTYTACGTYTVRVEATNSFGNKTVAQIPVSITYCPQSNYMMYVPALTLPELPTH